MTVPFDLLRAVHSRAARAAVGPSTVRGLRVSGVVKAAQTFLRGVDIHPFGTASPDNFAHHLDTTTLALRSALPPRARHWGVARKVINIFLRDCLYTHYLRNAFHLDLAESFLEIPIDKETATQLIAASDGRLERWKGVKYVTSTQNVRFQSEARRIASLLETDRVHLDALWWSVSRDSPPVG